MQFDENETVDKQEPELIEDQEIDQDAEVEQPEESETDSEEQQDESEDEVFSFGEDSPPQEDDGFAGKPAPEWVKKQRAENRELKKQLRELQQKQEQSTQVVNQPLTLGNKPTLAEYEYDEEQYDKALSQWYENKANFDKQQAELNSKKVEQEQEVKALVDNYNQRKASFNKDDFEEVENYVGSKLTQDQVLALFEVSKKPEVLVYALGKNQHRLEELASIKSPYKFAVAVSELENQVKATKRTAAAAPERKITSGQSGVASTDARLAELEKEAERTGNRSKLIQYKKSLNK